MDDKDPKDKSSKPVQTGKEAMEPVLDPGLLRALTTPNVWAEPPADAQPRKIVFPWSVHQATPKDGQPSDLFGLLRISDQRDRWFRGNVTADFGGT